MRMQSTVREASQSQDEAAVEDALWRYLAKIVRRWRIDGAKQEANTIVRGLSIIEKCKMYAKKVGQEFLELIEKDEKLRNLKDL